MSAPPVLQMVTPLPPATSGIAQYSRDLLAAVDGAWRMNVFAEGDAAPGNWATVRVMPAGGWAAFDPVAPTIYQLGNSGFHRHAYRLALTTPGVLVLHDVVLHHGRLGEFLRARGGAEYRRVMRARYGAAGDAVARDALRGRAPADLAAYPLFEDYVERARLTLTHSDYARRLVLERVPAADVRRVPMGIPLPAAISRAAARRALDVPADAFVVASVTHVNPFKRLPVVLRAIRRLRPRAPETLLLVAGSVAPGIDLAADIAYLGIERNARLLGYVSDDVARLVAAAADACVNLRRPSAGETSASLLRLLGAGRPVIVTDDAAHAEYPDAVALKLPVDRLEEETLAAMLLELRDRPDLAAARGAAARAFVEREHTLGAMLAGYRQALRDAYGVELPDLDAQVTREAPPAAPAPRRDAFGAFDAALAERVGGLALEQHAPTVNALARAMVDLGLHRSYDQIKERCMNDQSAIKPELLEILACPVCKTAVRLDGNELVCDTCGRHYKIEDGIPIMLVEDEE